MNVSVLSCTLIQYTHELRKLKLHVCMDIGVSTVLLHSLV